MNRRMTLQQDEKVLSTLTGLFETFDGMQNVYFGDLEEMNYTPNKNAIDLIRGETLRKAQGARLSATSTRRAGRKVVL
ncbi:hypothetical protein [Neobacillus jeddahensis]|uniref:hypothetical protein n=1 Tax=Neobacillus jeddahensis TaxID=1461580 RepID=UPI00058EA6CF|nr:hypothetical protein [Neobacillus jeddahensis]